MPKRTPGKTTTLRASHRGRSNRPRAAEQALRRSEELFSSVFRANPAAISLSSIESELFAVNDRYCEFFGCASEEVIGRRSLELGFWVEPAERERMVETLLAEGSIRAAEIHLRKKSGEICDALLSAELVRLPGDRERVIVAMFTDVTARKRAENTLKALLEISQKLNATLDANSLLDGLVLEAAALSGAEGGAGGLRTPAGLVSRHYLRGREFVPFDICWPPGVGWPGWLLEHKVPYIVKDAASDPLISPESRERYGVRSAVVMPILNALGEVIAFFQVHNKKDGSGFTEQDSSALAGLAQVAAIALQNALAYRRMRRAQSELRRLSRRLFHIQDSERRRIARQLHETTAQTLFALKMDLARLKAEFPEVNGRSADLLEESFLLAQGVMQEIRTLSYILHPPLLDEAGLAPALRWYVDGFAERSGIEVSLEAAEDFGRLPEEIETVLFRLVQECLSNVHRHSGSPTAAIRLARSDGSVSLEIEDAGRGMESFSGRNRSDTSGAPGVGIAAMRERVRQLEGTLEIHSSPGRGTRLRAVVPLASETSAKTPLRA